MRERRRDPLSGEWRTLSTDRQGRTFLPPSESCPLCPTTDPGRPTEVPWAEFEVAVFENRFPSLSAEPPSPTTDAHGVYDVEPARGATEVVVYSADHDGSLTSRGVSRVRLVVDVWTERYQALGRRADVDYVFIFENRGEAIGVTLHHPHGQIYGYPEIPPVAARELAEATRHRERHGTCVVCDIAAQEQADQARLVASNSAWLAYVPFAPRFPYEVHIAARAHRSSLLDISGAEGDELAEILTQVQQRYDRLFGFPLPYVMAVHQSPTDGPDRRAISHLHIEFTPVHRAADRLKYLAGSELGAGAFLVDVAPEDAAAALRDAGAS